MNMLEKTQAALAELFPQAEAGEGATEAAARQPGVLRTDPARHGSHLDVLCGPDQVVAVARIMDREGYFLEAVSGVDWLEKQQLEIIYDYNRLGGEHCRVMVRTQVPRSEAVVPTVSAVFPAADWHERETYDFYGVHFQDHPNLIRILLPEDADFHPLLKDFTP
ncbi:NADH-quinone oxidoreductase subunit C [Desulfobulbus sp.]|uniref:NADH-quinone oxidoreductase subunit C n=1 Tax=Desulfobulbus sp. TaxID=895 RepID=UPI0027B8CEF8|nr:NADH-quinone oxidoreductase subunit C [Desulfobulbus sp.]